MENISIRSLFAREILDSRGNPTVECELTMDNGQSVRASVPSGASTGKYEAYEMRDGDASRYFGKGVKKAVENVNNELSAALLGLSVYDQRKIDTLLCSLDGTEQKSRLGANAILSVSMAVAKAGALAAREPLWQYLARERKTRLPVPMMNILNGGAHAKNGLDVQEFMVVPVGASDFKEGLRMGAEIFHTLGMLLSKSGLSVGVGDEGGYAPELKNEEEALSWIEEAIAKAGYNESQVKISLDVAASEWATENGYLMPKSNRKFSAEDMIAWTVDLCEKHPILSVEDPLGEDDFSAFKTLTEQLEGKVLIVGDDLFVTNTRRLSLGIKESVANAILIKPNQIGTVSETLDVIRLAKENGYKHILSHRSGETEETIISDLAVATEAHLIKTGAPSRGERVVKYNRLLRIEEEIGKPTVYGF